MYLVTQNNSFLVELSKSWDSSIYTLYAKELLDVKIDNIVYGKGIGKSKKEAEQMAAKDALSKKANNKQKVTGEKK